MQSKLTAKEVDFISDLLTLEESVCKKARIYSKTLTDRTVSEQMKTVADNSAKRYAELLGLLN